jgi:catechol 2,3-dioxygenase-like lactoylglutathione lyase family enzyme
MLGQFDAIATVGVNDISSARSFYEGVLGLTLVDTEGDQVVTYQSGTSRIMVYVSEFAGTNKATALTWVLGESLDQVVQQLKSKAVRFEHYDMPGGERQGDVHVFGRVRVAWFKDPFGNIISLVNG